MTRLNALMTVVLLYTCYLLLTGCANEKRFVRFHDKVPQKAASYCAGWYPVKDSTHVQVMFQPGDTVYISNAAVYADCDSAYRAALLEAARTGKPVVVRSVAVQTVTKLIHDTATVETVTYRENTAALASSEMELVLEKARTAKYQAAYHKWRKWAAIGYGVLFVLVCAGAIMEYEKHRPI